MGNSYQEKGIRTPMSLGRSTKIISMVDSDQLVVNKELATRHIYSTVACREVEERTLTRKVRERDFVEVALQKCSPDGFWVLPGSLRL